MLFILCLSSSFIIGYKIKDHRSSRVVVIVFSIMISASVYLILDLDKPGSGLINIDAAEN
jgi:hypothetical protein